MERDMVTILDIPFLNETAEKLVEETEKAILNKQKRFIVTANPEIVMYAKKDKEYQRILQTADSVIPDGIGIIIASKIMRTPIRERVAGFDFMQELLKKADEHQWRVFLLGAKEEVVEKAVENIVRRFPNLVLAGFHHGFFDQKDARVAEKVKEAKPDLVFAALGFPRQEYWIYDNLHQFPAGLFMGVGGSFDVLAGKVKRAPAIWRKLNLEWLYRLFKQPKRWKRMLALPEFLLEILKYSRKR